MSWLQRRAVQKDEDYDDSSSSSGSSGSSSSFDSDSSASSYESSDDDSQQGRVDTNNITAPPTNVEGQAKKSLDTVEAFYVEQEAKEGDFETEGQAASEQITSSEQIMASEQIIASEQITASEQIIASEQVTTEPAIEEQTTEQVIGSMDRYATFDEEDEDKAQEPVLNGDVTAEVQNSTDVANNGPDEDARTIGSKSVHSSEKSIVVITSNEEEVVIQVSNEDQDEKETEGGFELEVVSTLYSEKLTNNQGEIPKKDEEAPKNEPPPAKPVVRSETDEIIPKRISSTIMQDLSITVSDDDSSSDSSSDSSVSSDSSDSSSDYDIETQSIPSPTHTHHGYNTLETGGESPSKEAPKLEIETKTKTSSEVTPPSPKTDNGIEVSISSHALTSSDSAVPDDSNATVNDKEVNKVDEQEVNRSQENKIHMSTEAGGGADDAFAEDEEDSDSSSDDSISDDSVSSDSDSDSTSSDSSNENDNEKGVKADTKKVEQETSVEVAGAESPAQVEEPTEKTIDAPQEEKNIDDIVSKFKQQQPMKEDKVENIDDILAKLRIEQSKREEKVEEVIKAEDGFGEDIEHDLADFQEKKEMTDYRSIFSFPVPEKEKAVDEGISLRCDVKSEREDVVLDDVMSLRNKVVKPDIAWWVEDGNASETVPDDKESESPQKTSEEWFLKQFQEAEAEDNALDVDELNRRLEQARLEETTEFSPRRIWWKVKSDSSRKVELPAPETRQWYFDSVNDTENFQGLANGGKVYTEKAHKKRRTWLTVSDANDKDKLREFMGRDDSERGLGERRTPGESTGQRKEGNITNNNESVASDKENESNEGVNKKVVNIDEKDKESNADEKEKPSVEDEEEKKASEGGESDDESAKKDDDSNTRLTIQNVIQQIQKEASTKIQDGVYVQEESPEELVTFTEPLTFTDVSQKNRSAKDILKKNSKKSKKVPSDFEDPSPQIFDLIEGAMGSSTARRTNACGTIKLLASKKKNVSMLIKSFGLLKALAFVIGEEPSKDELEARENARLRALSTLVMLSQPKEGRRIICEQEGLLPALVDVLVASKGEACLHACSILAALAKTEENRDTIAATNFLLRRLSVILKTTKVKVDEPDQSQSESESESKTTNDNEEESEVDNSTEATNSTLQKQLNAMRLNSCAAMLHLSKQCSVVAKICKDHKIIANIAAVCLEKDSTLHTKCIEILCNLTRFPGNSTALSRSTQVSAAFHACGVSKIGEDRLFTMRSLQNLTANPACREKLATIPILDMLRASAQKLENKEEQEAAVATLANLCTNTTAVIRMANCKDILPTLIKVAYNDDCTPEVQFNACNAISRIAAWFQTFASATTFDEIKNKDPLPTMVAKGSMRWDFVE